MNSGDTNEAHGRRREYGKQTQWTRLGGSQNRPRMGRRRKRSHKSIRASFHIWRYVKHHVSQIPLFHLFACRPISAALLSFSAPISSNNAIYRRVILLYKTNPCESSESRLSSSKLLQGRRRVALTNTPCSHGTIFSSLPWFPLVLCSSHERSFLCFSFLVYLLNPVRNIESLRDSSAHDLPEDGNLRTQERGAPQTKPSPLKLSFGRLLPMHMVVRATYLRPISTGPSGFSTGAFFVTSCRVIPTVFYTSSDPP